MVGACLFFSLSWLSRSFKTWSCVSGGEVMGSGRGMGYNEKKERDNVLSVNLKTVQWI